MGIPGQLYPGGMVMPPMKMMSLGMVCEVIVQNFCLCPSGHEAVELPPGQWPAWPAWPLQVN